MGIVRPYDDLGLGVARVEKVHEGVERVRHVRIAQVPGRISPREHRAVAGLGVGDKPSVLLGAEGRIRIDATIACSVLGRPPTQLDELGHDVVLARRAHPDRGRVAVGLGILPKVIEAGVALTRPCRGGRIDRVEIAEDRLDRGAQAVEIEPIEPDALRLRPCLVVVPQPTDEIDDVGVAPHPRRKSLEVAECLDRMLIAGSAEHISIHAIRVRPIRLDSNGREALRLNQPAGDEGTCPVELVGAM